MVFNGEIYNYLELRAELARDEGAVFRTEGDGEAIVAAFHHWGRIRCAGCAGCSRSRSGTPPTTRCSSPATRSASSRCSSRRTRGTAFGSEKKSLLELIGRIGLGDDLDPRAIEHYTVLQYVPEPESLHRSIRRLESAPTRPLAGFSAFGATLLRAAVRGTSGDRRDPAAALRRHRAGAARLGRQTHARRRDRRIVPVRRYRLNGNRRAGHPAQSGSDHVHHRFPARAIRRSTSRPNPRRPSAPGM